MPLVRKRRADAQPSPPPPAPQRQRSSTPPSPGSSRGSGDGDGGDGDLSRVSEEQMVKKLVRLALAAEHARVPIRRADVTARVLGPESSRAFKAVFAAADARLRDTFGMQLVELPGKERVTVQQKRAAQRAGTAAAAGGAAQAGSNRAWVLVSTLPRGLRAPEIAPPPRVPSVQAEAAYAGLYTFVVAAIYLSEGQRVSERKLEAHLKTCNVGDTVLAREKTDAVLRRMERQGYLVKIRERDGAGGEETVDYVVGPRAKVEIGEDGVAGMVRQVYGGGAHDMDDLEDRLETSLGRDSFRRDTGQAQPEGQAAAAGDAGSSGPPPRQAARPGGQGETHYGRRSTRSRPAEAGDESGSGGSGGADSDMDGE